MKKTLLFFIITIGILSCNKEDDSNDTGLNNPNIQKLSKKITTNNSNGLGTIFTSLYAYNEDGIIESFTSETPNGSYTTHYNYDDPNKTVLEYESEDPWEFKLENGLIVSSIKYNSTSNTMYDYTYNAARQLITSRRYLGLNVYCDDNIAYDGNDNAINVDPTCGDTVFQFEFDNKKNPDSNIYNEAFLKLGRTGENNISRMIATEILSSDTNIVDYEYDYDSEGYPLMARLFNMGELVGTIEYIYQ